ncbi:MAG TPA: hypothetical protein VI139_04555 [Gemmatimonadales bacterium]
MSIWGKLRVGLGVAFLLFIGYTGITDGWHQVNASATLGQRIQTATQLLFGLLAVAVVGALAARHRWSRPLLIGWGAVLSISAGFAVVVWGGQGALPAAAATLATALIAAFTLWAVTPAMRPSPV